MDSIAAKEKMRFNFQESHEMLGEFKKTLNSLGRGGRRWTAAKQLPFGPQQNPSLSPVRSSMPHVRHCRGLERLFLVEPQESCRVVMGPMAQVLSSLDIVKER